MFTQPAVISSRNNMTQFSVYAYSQTLCRDIEIARFDTIVEAAQFQQDVWGKQ